MKKSEIFYQVKHPTEVNDYYHIYNKSNVLNVLYWNNFFEMIHSLEGDIVECGVGRGRSMIAILALQQFYKATQEREVYALDSFEGFPEPSVEDQSYRAPKKGEWSRSPNNQFNYSIENLKIILEKADLPIKECTIVKGFFEKTTRSLTVDKIAILHLDGDLYESIKQPLKNLSDKVIIGGIIVIDDYTLDDPNKSGEAFPGARKAVDEFLSGNTDFEIRTSIRGTPFIVRLS